SRGRDDRLQALTVAGRNGEGDAIAHPSNSHATPQNGIPKSDSFDPINPLEGCVKFRSAHAAKRARTSNLTY
ncbi:hypothetical protein, partial [Mesorhizobium sp.]|uniref:hypothetical protein n=1 Tax=Mesorhizobium sp. TaxID=1871066 RepID=UPI0025D07F8A